MIQRALTRKDSWGSPPREGSKRGASPPPRALKKGFSLGLAKFLFKPAEERTHVEAVEKKNLHKRQTWHEKPIRGQLSRLDSQLNYGMS